MFPVLHGLYGEDGTVQGILELADPLCGLRRLASAVSMDKLSTKLIVKDLGIRQAEYVPVMKEELEQMDQVAKRVEDGVPVMPVLIKPCPTPAPPGACPGPTTESPWKTALRRRRSMTGGSWWRR